MKASERPHGHTPARSVDAPARAARAARAGGRSARVVSEVLRATAEELGRVGYLALRVEDVALHAGVNKTTIYRRWPTKADLVSAVLRDAAEGCEAPPDTGAVRDDLLLLVGRLAEHGRAPWVKVMMAECIHPEVYAIVHRLKHQFEADWVRAIARGMARGEVPPDASPLLVTELITSAVIGRIVRGEEAPDAPFRESVVDLVLAGAGATARGLVRPAIARIA